MLYIIQNEKVRVCTLKKFTLNFHPDEIHIDMRFRLDVCKRMVTTRLQGTGVLLLLYVIHPLVLPKEINTHTHKENKNNP